jgi:hypothetical protein
MLEDILGSDQPENHRPLRQALLPRGNGPPLPAPYSGGNNGASSTPRSAVIFVDHRELMGEDAIHTVPVSLTSAASPRARRLADSPKTGGGPMVQLISNDPPCRLRRGANRVPPLN